MGYNLRFPNITGATPQEMMPQVKSYLYQLVEELQWAMNSLDKAQLNIVSTVTKSSSSDKKPTAIDANATFDAVKGLIIKSADIVNAYYEEINKRLEGAYVAQSDFGTYMEQTNQGIEANSTQIEQTFNNIQGILTDVENIESSLIEVNAHIKSGLLYYDDNEIPIYGIEVGQRTEVDGEEVFRKYARFTSDRLSFYDQNDNEVAYISDKKLYITSIEVLYSYKIGGFIDTVDVPTGDVVTKWLGVGGSG